MSTAANQRKPEMRKTLLHRLSRMIGAGPCVLVVFLAASCSVAEMSFQPVSEPASLILYLQPLPQEAHRLNFTVDTLVVRRKDGQELPLDLPQTSFEGARLVGVQKKLLAASLPPGRYLGLKLQIKSASMNGEEGRTNLLPPGEPIHIDYAFTITEKQTQALLITLSQDRLVTDGAFFTPKFSLWKPERMLRNLKGFVSNGGSQNLTVFNKKSALVADAIQVGKQPRDMALDQRRGWLYVALAGEDSIAVVEVNNKEILGQVRLRFGDEPTELALSASGNRLLSLNKGSQSVSIIDTASLSELGRIRLSSGANDVFIGRSEDRAYVIQPVSTTLSVLDLGAFRVRNSIVLSDLPLKGVVSSDDKTLFLINDFSAELLVVDSASLSVKKKIFVGNGARSIIRHAVSGLLYIGKHNGEIAVVDPNALMPIDTFVLPGPVRAMAIDNVENVLFAMLPQSRRLLKIDLVSKRQLGVLTLGSESHAVIVMGER